VRNCTHHVLLGWRRRWLRTFGSRASGAGAQPGISIPGPATPHAPPRKLRRSVGKRRSVWSVDLACAPCGALEAVGGLEIPRLKSRAECLRGFAAGSKPLSEQLVRASTHLTWLATGRAKATIAPDAMIQFAKRSSRAGRETSGSSVQQRFIPHRSATRDETLFVLSLGFQMDDVPPEFELPPGEAMLRCECGFESEPFCFDEHLYGCLTCSSVKSAIRVPFLYQPPKCPDCDSQFAISDRIRAGPSARCPACCNNTLMLEPFGVDYQTVDCGDSIPEVGQTIHAKTMPSDHPDVEVFFWSPRLKMEYAVAVSITNRDPSTIPWAHHEFRVESVEHSPPRLRLAYVRELNESEWRWFLA